MSYDSAGILNVLALKNVLNVKEVNDFAIFNAKANLSGTIRAVEIEGTVVDEFLNNSDLHVISLLNSYVALNISVTACLAFITLNCDQVSCCINDCGHFLSFNEVLHSVDVRALKLISLGREVFIPRISAKLTFAELGLLLGGRLRFSEDFLPQARLSRLWCAEVSLASDGSILVVERLDRLNTVGGSVFILDHVDTFVHSIEWVGLVALRSEGVDTCCCISKGNETDNILLHCDSFLFI